MVMREVEQADATAEETFAELERPQAGEPDGLRAEIIAAMRTVHDPEIPVNIYDLGLIYRLDIDADGRAVIEMTLTAPNCPVADMIPTMVADAVQQIDRVVSADVSLVWEPVWGPERMSEEARLALDLF